MKISFQLSFILALSFLVFACNDDVELAPIPILDIKVELLPPIDNCGENLIGFTRHEVEFYIDYSNYFQIQPATFETVTEQYVVQEAGTTNSMYALDSFLVCKKDSFLSYRLTSNEDTISIISNFCELDTLLIPCADADLELDSVLFPKQEIYLTYEKLLEYVPGGDTIEVQLDTRTSQRLASQPMIMEVDSFQRIIASEFIVPDTTNIEMYLDSITTVHFDEGCLTAKSYRIIE